jgi:hypothetical protein
MQRLAPGAVPARSQASFGLATLLLVVCLLAVCLGLGRIDPLLGAIAAMIAAPAFARTAEIARRARYRGATLPSRHKLLLFLSSLLLVTSAIAATLLVAVTIGGFAAACGVVYSRVFGEPWMPLVMFLWGLVLGMPAGLITGALVVQRWWPT